MSWSAGDVNPPLEALLRSLATGMAESVESRRTSRWASRLGVMMHKLDQRLARPGETQSDRIRVFAFFLILPIMTAVSFLIGAVMASFGYTFLGAMVLVLATFQTITITTVFMRWLRTNTAVVLLLGLIQLAGAVAHFALGGFEKSGLALTWSAVSVPLVSVMMRSRMVVFWFAVSGISFSIAATVLAEQPWELFAELRRTQGLDEAFGTAVICVNVLLPMLVIVTSTVYFDVRFVSEQKFSDDLLYRIMPRKVAARLKLGVPRQALVERYEHVTCFFSDVVGYTSMAAQHTPVETIAMLDRMYEKMDAAAIRFGVHKVATIGDAYFAVTGCPVASTPEADAHKMAQFALAVRDSLAGEVGVSVRIGLHSGPVVAGVIGELAPQFTLIGATVTTAGLIEAHGRAGMIHVSEECARLIADRYECLPRPPIRLRNTPLQTYWLSGVHDDRGQRRRPSHQSSDGSGFEGDTTTQNNHDDDSSSSYEDDDDDDQQMKSCESER